MPGGRPPKHGLSHTRAYRCYRSAIQRCGDPTHRAYPYYGGAGVRVCDEWVADFASFYAHMGDCPEGHTLERKTNEKGYEPGNCVWLPKTLQSRNRRSCVYFMVNGKRLTMAEAAREKGLAWQTVQTRLRAGDNKDQALRPVLSRNGK